MRLLMSAVALGFVVVAVAAFLITANLPSAKPGALLLADDRAVVAAGAEIYQESCAACHGEELEGQPNWRQPDAEGMLPAPPHDETGHTWHHTDDVLFGITKFGLAAFAGLANHSSNMPVYEDVLADDEIIAVLSYIKAQWPEEVRARHDALNAAAAAQE